MLVDNSGGAGSFKVEEVGGGHTALDLGVLTSVAATTIQGHGILSLGGKLGLEEPHVVDPEGAGAEDLDRDDVEVGTRRSEGLEGADALPFDLDDLAIVEKRSQNSDRDEQSDDLPTLTI